MTIDRRMRGWASMCLRESGEVSIGGLLLLAPFVVTVAEDYSNMASVGGWYEPGWWVPFLSPFNLFSVMYCLVLGSSAFLVWRAQRPGRLIALAVYFAFLVIPTLEPVLFTQNVSYQEGTYSLMTQTHIIATIQFLLMALLITLYSGHSKKAAWLLVPVFIFAGYIMQLSA